MPISAEARAEIEAKAAASVEAMNRKDFAGFANAIHGPDIVMIPEGMPPARGHAEVVAFLEGFPPFTNMAFELDEIDGDGDCAYVLGKYSFDFVDDAGNVTGSDNGSYVEIWRRRDDGWWVTRDIFNSDNPAE
ncbi:MAG: nuclear transport factor 2 family protein [Gemmatimonadota bacterium]|nr:nuclear transport factor 2 family protein [Gemmatimonadota bacterium]